MFKQQNSNIGGSASHTPGWVSLSLGMAFALSAHSPAIAQQSAPRPIVLHAARLLETDTGRMITPGEILVEGEGIAATRKAVSHSAGAHTVHLAYHAVLP